MRPMTMSPAVQTPDVPTLELLVTDKVGLLVGVVGVVPVPDAIEDIGHDVGTDTLAVIDDGVPPRMTMSLGAPRFSTRRPGATERLPSRNDGRVAPKRSLA